MKVKPDFAAFTSASVHQKNPPQPGCDDRRFAGMKHLQVRLVRADAVRLRRIAEERDQTIQAALVEAINLYLRNANQPPAPDPGTR